MRIHVPRPLTQPEKSRNDAREVAATAMSGPSIRLPYADAIQRAFGRHDVSDARAHMGPAASAAARALSAHAFATGNDVVFGGRPNLQTAAHEAAHLVQQRYGASPRNGIGEPHDAYERQADVVAQRVVSGRSAEDVLDGAVGQEVGGEEGAVQLMRIPVPVVLQGLGLPAVIDTSQYTLQQLDRFDDILDDASENPRLYGSDPVEFQQLIGSVSEGLTRAMIEDDYATAPVVTTLPPTIKVPSSMTPFPTMTNALSTSFTPSSTPSFAPSLTPSFQPSPISQLPTQSPFKPTTSTSGVNNPHAGIVKYLRKDFGKGVHEQMHFKPTNTKTYHGVWTVKPAKYVGIAIDAIYANTGVAASKAGTKGSYRYLVDVGTIVGYLSGSTVPYDEAAKTPATTYVEVMLDKKGNTISAFPSSPDYF